MLIKVIDCNHGIEARFMLRQQFNQPMQHSPEKSLKLMHQVNHILRHNLLQAEQVNNHLYKFNIHSEHELGDNNSRLKKCNK